MVNYQKSVIYKLCCKDASITDEYIGSTTNKDRRKYGHKGICNNENSKNHNYPVYQFIRNNGGFENWDMIILEEFPCESKIQLCQRERYWIEERNPTLNIRRPIITEEEKLELQRRCFLSLSRTDEYKEKRKEYEKTDERIEYKKKYEKTDKRREYKKKYNKTDEYREYQKQYHLQIKLKNKSAIVIQRFFNKYFK